MKKAIITISGGIDSTLTAAIAKKEGYELYFLTVNYGQRNLEREINNTSFLAKYYEAKQHKIIDMTWLGNLGNSMITDSTIAVDPNNDHQIYVPFRNTCILSAAIAWAETDLSIKKIYIGSDGESEEVCPDNSPQYINSINELIKVSVKNNKELEVVAPLNYLTKPEINKVISKNFDIKQKNPLNQAMIETLAIIAYNEPCTRTKIHEMRKADPTPILDKLIELGLVEQAGRSEAVGKPYLYQRAAYTLLHHRKGVRPGRRWAAAHPLPGVHRVSGNQEHSGRQVT